MNEPTNRFSRSMIDVHRRVDLLNHPAVHQHDPLPERHRFDLVVRHVDHGRLESLVEPGDLGPHLHAKLSIEIRQRLVEQKHLRFADDGAAERHTLPLATGELARSAFEQRLDRENVRGVLHALLDFRLRRTPHLQAECHVLVDRHVRIEGVILEDHRDVALAGGDVVYAGGRRSRFHRT